jgi:hypothetical protein
LHVLEIDSDDADDQAEALTGALRSRVRSSPAWALPETTHTLRMLTAALRCPPRPDPACLQRIGDQIKSDRFAWGTLSKSGGRQVTVEMHLWTRGQPDVAIKETYSENLRDQNDDTLRKIAMRIIDRLTSGPTLVTSPNVLAASNPSADVDLERTPEAAPSRPVQEPSEPGSARKVLGWTGVIGGGLLLAAGGALGIVFESSVGTLNSDRRNNYGNPTQGATIEDPCTPPPGESNSATSSGCNAQNTARIVLVPEIAALGAGGALAVAGIILLATAPKHEASSPTSALGLGTLKLVPQFGVRSALLQLCASF